VKRAIVLLIGLIFALTFFVSCTQNVVQTTDAKTASDLADKTAQLQEMTAKYNKAMQSLLDSKIKLFTVKAELAISNTFFIPAFTGELDAMSETEQALLVQDVQAKINSLGDPTIKSKFDAIVNSNGGDQETADFFVYLLQDMEMTVK
jgi:hypothetical protein